jgi:Holliday junction resolvase RusA-like endonuclease
MQRIEIKPMSVNQAWQGRRYKTKEYAIFERNVMALLTGIKLPSPPYKLTLHLAFSNKASDIDNPIKLISDILQKRYGINDKDIYELVVKKVIVAKGREYFEFKIESL